MGRNNFNIEQIKQQIENADNDQLNDQYTEALNKNFGKVAELNKQVTELNPRINELAKEVKTCTDAALTAVYTVENHLQVVMSPETKEKVRDACEAIGDGVITSFNTQTKALLNPTLTLM